MTTIEKGANQHVGALAHETQAAIVAVQYVEQGSSRQNAIETEMKVDNVEKTLELLEAAGIVEFELNEKESTFKFLDISNGTDLNFGEK